MYTRNSEQLAVVLVWLDAIEKGKGKKKEEVHLTLLTQ